jgi:putative transposase
MKKSKFTESHIIGILKAQEGGRSVSDICREHGIGQPAFYQWKSKYSGKEIAQLKKLKEPVTGFTNRMYPGNRSVIIFQTTS